MWDRPELLDRVSGALIALSVLLVAYAGIVGIANAPWFPVRLVSAMMGRPPGESDAPRMKSICPPTPEMTRCPTESAHT